MDMQTAIASSGEHPRDTNHKHDSGWRPLLRDAVLLADLQWQIFREDSREAGQSIARVLAVTTAGSLAMLAALPVVLLGIAEFLNHFTTLTLWGALLLVGVVTFGAGGVATYVAVRQVHDVVSQFRRSREELARNVDWLQQVKQRVVG